MPDRLAATISIAVKKRDELAEHRLFLLQMGVSPKEVDKRLDLMKTKQTRLTIGGLPAKKKARLETPYKRESN